jgi:hypothetical protein
VTAVAVAVGTLLVLAAAAAVALTMRAVTDPAARRDRDELRQRESLSRVLDGHTGSGTGGRP